MTAKEFEAEFWTNQDPQDKYTFAEAYAAYVFRNRGRRTFLGANPPNEGLGDKPPKSE